MTCYEAKVSMSQNDQQAVNVKENTAKLSDSHYEIALPWKNYTPDLRTNRFLTWIEY